MQLHNSSTQNSLSSVIHFDRCYLNCEIHASLMLPHWFAFSV